MIRQFKRVPLNFDWPLHQVWKGYVNPYNYIECKTCDGSGLNPETKKLSDDWYDFKGTGRKWCYNINQEEINALIKEGRLMDFTHVPRNEKQRKIVEEKIKKGENSWLSFNNGYVPTTEEVNNWARKGMGHDAINRWVCVKTRAKRLGIYGKCKYCKGEGELCQSTRIKKLHESWKKIEPPKGKGYQLWEDVSEGSPISPVFKTIDELCEWAENNATTFADYKTTKEEWKKMFEKNFVSHQVGNMVFM